MISYIQPFSTEKKLGEVYNQQCSDCSTEYICVQDYDCMVLCPETFQVIENAVKAYPDTAIFGAYTNRVQYAHQRLTPMSENDSIRYHLNIARARAKEFPFECEQVKTVAGFFMLFKKSYWEQSPFQESIINEYGYLFDRHFCLHARRSNLPIRIIKGAYVFHSYRIDKNYRDQSHLKVTSTPT